MKLAMIVTVMLLCVTRAQAQGWQAELAGAWTAPVSDFSKLWKPGIGMRATVSYGLSGIIGAEAAGAFGSFDMDAERVGEDINRNPDILSGGTGTIMTVMAGLRFARPNGFVRPFASIHAGLYSVTMSDVQVGRNGALGTFTASPQSVVGFRGALGITVWTMTRLGITMATDYTHALTDNEAAGHGSLIIGLAIR